MMNEHSYEGRYFGVGRLHREHIWIEVHAGVEEVITFYVYLFFAPGFLACGIRRMHLIEDSLLILTWGWYITRIAA